MLQPPTTPKSLRIGGLDLGGMDLRYRERFVESRFVPLDRANDIEFNRKWGVDSLATGDERIREASLTYLPPQGSRSVRPTAPSSAEISRIPAVSKGMCRSASENLPLLLYNVEDIRSTDLLANLESHWFRQSRLRASTRSWASRPGVRYEGENRRLAHTRFAGAPGRGASNSTTIAVFTPPSGTRAVLGAGGVRMAHRQHLPWIRRRARVAGVHPDLFRPPSKEWETISSSLDITLRQRTYAQEFKLEGKQDIQTVLVRNNTRLSPLNRGIEADLYYEVSTEQASRLERVYVRVTPGSGNYRYLGDVNGNGLADDAEFVARPVRRRLCGAHAAHG